MQLLCVTSIEDAFRIGEQIEREIHDVSNGGLFTKDKAMYLEFEKSLENLLLLRKKTYVSMKHTYDKKLGKIVGKFSQSGTKPIRRDNSKIVRDISLDLFKDLVKDGNYKTANDKIRNKMSKMLNNTLPIDDLVTSQKLNSWNPKIINAGVAVAKKRKNRGGEVGLGDRIKYYVTAGKKRAKVSALAEDPEYGKTNKVPGNFSYYTEMIDKALRPVLEVAYKNDSEKLKEGNDLFDINTYEKVVVKNGPLAKFFGTNTTTIGAKRKAYKAKINVVENKKQKVDIKSFF
jgi:DNA polymerase elongation subunit (family B)